VPKGYRKLNGDSSALIPDTIVPINGHAEQAGRRGNANPGAAFYGLIDPLRLAGQPVPSRKWMVEGLIPDADTTILSGHGGEGKSWLSLQLAICAATGRDWLGLPTKACKVFYFSAEDGKDELHNRLAQITAGLGLGIGDLENLSLADRSDQDNVLMEFERHTEKGTETPVFWQVLNHALDIGAGLIVLDSKHNLFAGNENSRPVAFQFMRGLRSMARETQAAVVLIDHPSRAGRQTGDGDAGNTAWHNAARARLYLTASDTEADERTLATKKANYAARTDDISIRWKDGAFIRIGEQGGGLIANLEQRAAETAFLDCLRALCAEGFHPSVTVSARDNYAPRLMHGRQEVAGLSLRVLERAMHAVRGDGRAVIAQTDGPPTRRRPYLKPADASPPTQPTQP
jgi:RecA-family ATPase